MFSFVLEVFLIDSLFFFKFKLLLFSLLFYTYILCIPKKAKRVEGLPSLSSSASFSDSSSSSDSNSALYSFSNSSSTYNFFSNLTSNYFSYSISTATCFFDFSSSTMCFTFFFTASCIFPSSFSTNTGPSNSSLYPTCFSLMDLNLFYDKI